LIAAHSQGNGAAWHAFMSFLFWESFFYVYF
jgi:hypothetical protein